MTIHFSQASPRTLPAEGLNPLGLDLIFGRTFSGWKECPDPAPHHTNRGAHVPSVLQEET